MNTKPHPIMLYHYSPTVLWGSVIGLACLSAFLVLATQWKIIPAPSAHPMEKI